MGWTASDIMNRNVISVRSDMDLRDLAKLFLEKGITGAPVVDSEGELVGVISQTDLLYYNLTRGDELVADSAFYQSVQVEGGYLPRGFQVEDVNTGRVEDVMTPVVHSVPETADVESVARMMTRKHIHRVIVRHGRKVSGIISALDVLRVLEQPQAAARGKRPAAAASRKKQGAARGKAAASKKTARR
jgi:CBS domain-containing protein